MSEHFILPAHTSIVVLIAGIILLLLALLADALKLLGRDTSPSTRGAVRVVLGIAGAVLLGWAALSLGARPPPPSAPSAAATSAVPATDLVQSASALIAKCPLPVAPQVPDAATASLAQMQAAAQAFKAYDAGTVAYTQCVDAAVDQLHHQSAATASAAELKQLEDFGTAAHNTVIDQEQSLADKLNTQVRLYKSQHPH
jgi:hypothetical protein